MALFSFTYDDSSAQKKIVFGGIAAHNDLRPAWQEIYKYLLSVESSQFNSEGQRGGARWKPLSEKYRRWKEIRYPGKGILELTGQLKKSLSGAGKGHRKLLSPRFMVFGTMTPYAIYHQVGTSKMPIRNPVKLTDDDTRKIRSVIKAYLIRSIGGR